MDQTVQEFWEEEDREIKKYWEDEKTQSMSDPRIAEVESRALEERILADDTGKHFYKTIMGFSQPRDPRLIV